MTKLRWETWDNTARREDGIVVEEAITGRWVIDGPVYVQGLDFGECEGALDYADRHVPDQRGVEGPHDHTISVEDMPGLGAHTMGAEQYVQEAKARDAYPEPYPDDNPKTAEGLKKTPLRLVPTVGVEAEARVFALGAKKYGPYNWRERTVSCSVYYEAALRHLFAWYNGEDIDPESGEAHIAHARACMGIVLDAEAHGKLNDDRPPRPNGEPFPPLDEDLRA